MRRTCILISILAAWAAGSVEDYFPYPVRNLSDAVDLKKDSAIICFGTGLSDLGKQVQSAVSEKFKVTIPLLADSEADSARVRKSHLILIGNGMDNLVLRRLYYNHKCLLDAANPGNGGFFVASVHDPLYNGKNAVIIGGSSKAGHERAVSEFVKILGSLQAPVLKGLFSAKTPFDTLEAGDTLSYDSLVRLHCEEYKNASYGGQVLGKAVSNLMYFYWTRKPAFKKRGVSVLEAYLRLARESNDDFYGFHPMNDVYFATWRWVAAWELVEADPAFTERDKKVVLSATWGVYRYIEEKLTKTYMNPDITVEGEPRQNHVIFGTYSCFITTRYFAERYGLREKEKWYGLVDNVMKGQRNSYKPNDDANHYIWIVPNFTLSYDLCKGDTAWATSRLPRLAEAIVAVTGNDKIVVNFGDASGGGKPGLEDGLRIVNMAAYFNRDPALLGFCRWAEGKPSGRNVVQASRSSMGTLGFYDFEGKTAAFTKYAGVFPVLLDEGALHWIARRAPSGAHLPRGDGRYIDKLSIRPDFNAKSEYLLLEGVGGMSHSHTDGNSIADLMWNGKHFLTDGIYDAIYPEFHSMLRVRKDGVVGQRAIITELVSTHESRTAGLSTTRSPDATGADWYRHILWIKGKGFFVMDEAEALSDGRYDFNNRFRTQGERALSGNTLALKQGEETFLITCGGGPALSLSEEKLRNNRASRQIAGMSPANAPVEMLLMDKSASLSRGESFCFGALMAAQGGFREHSVVPLETRGGHAFLLGGTMAAGTARKGLTAGGFSVVADQFLVTRETLECAGLSFLSLGRARLASSRPVSLSVNLKTGAADLACPERADITVKGALKTAAPGKHALSLAAFPALGEFQALPALSPARTRDEAARPPRDFGMKIAGELKTSDSVLVVEKTGDEKGLLLGTKTGRVTLVGLAPEARFSMQAGAQVCALLGADVNSDKKQEYFAGTRDPSLLRLDETGKILWENKYDLSYGYADAASALARGRYKGRDCLLYGSQGWLVKYLAADGGLLAKTFVRYHSVTDLAAGDFNNDGKWEIYAGNNYHTPVNLLDEDGKRVWHLWDQVGSEARSISAYAGLNCTRLSACDLNGDGRQEAVYGTFEGQVFAFDITAGRLLYAFVGGPVTDLWAGALADKAAAPVIAVATRYGDLTLFSAAGERLAFTDTKTAILDLEVSDITGDGTRELLTALSDGTLRVFDASLNLYACFSRPGNAQAVKVLGKSVFGVYSDGTVVKLEAMKRNPVSGGIHY